jgi:hypothetical protein
MDKKRILTITIFSAVVFGLSLAYTIYISSKGGYQEVEGKWDLFGLGDGLGLISVILMLFIYFRSVFKIIVNTGGIWSRLGPVISEETTRPIMKKILGILNRVHPYAGVLAIVVVYLHCAFISDFMKNILLWALLALLLWQGVFGFFLTFKYTPMSLKKKSFLLHAQIVSGFLILILAGLGHFILGL